MIVDHWFYQSKILNKLGNYCDAYLRKSKNSIMTYLRVYPNTTFSTISRKKSTFSRKAANILKR